MAEELTPHGHVASKPYTPQIHIFACNGDLDAVRAELATGVSPNLRDGSTPRSQNTPLHEAAASHSSPDSSRSVIVTLLVDHGAEVDAVTWSGATALHLAVMNGHTRCVAALLAAGASPDLERGRAEFGNFQSPTELIGAKHRIILPMLLRAGAPLPRYDRAARCPTLYAGLLAYDLRAGANWLQRPENAVARRYFIKVRAAGSWAAYEKLHRASLVARFVPVFSRVLPAQPARLVVEFFFHTGFY